MTLNDLDQDFDKLSIYLAYLRSFWHIIHSFDMLSDLSGLHPNLWHIICSFSISPILSVYQLLYNIQSFGPISNPSSTILEPITQSLISGMMTNFLTRHLIFSIIIFQCNVWLSYLIVSPSAFQVCDQSIFCICLRLSQKIFNPINSSIEFIIKI